MAGLKEQVLDAMDILVRKNRPEVFPKLLENGWQPQPEHTARGEAFLESFKIAARFIALDRMIAISKMEMQGEPGLVNSESQIKASYWAEVMAKHDPENFQAFCRSVLASKQILAAAILNGADLQTITQNLSVKSLLRTA